MKTENHMDRRKQSKRLSWLLRHGAVDAGVAMDAAGWVSVAEVLRYTGMSAAELDDVVATNTKRRLQVEGDRIRACQGHSHDNRFVDADALEASWDIFEAEASIWHGTKTDVVPAIAKQGLISGQRTHVHLAPAPGSVVGKRANVSVLLEVSPAVVREAGLALFSAPNGVVLVRRVPPEAIVGLEPISRRALSQAEALRALFPALH